MEIIIGSIVLLLLVLVLVYYGYQKTKNNVSTDTPDSLPKMTEVPVVEEDKLVDDRQLTLNITPDTSLKPGKMAKPKLMRVDGTESTKSSKTRTYTKPKKSRKPKSTNNLG